MDNKRFDCGLLILNHQSCSLPIHSNSVDIDKKDSILTSLYRTLIRQNHGELEGSWFQPTLLDARALQGLHIRVRQRTVKGKGQKVKSFPN